MMKSPNYPNNDCPKSKIKAARSLRIFLFVSLFFFIIFAALIVTLALTLFKPKNPGVSVHPIGLENFEFFQPNSTTVPLGLVITIVNENYGSFKYTNSTGYIYYHHDTIVANAPLVTNLVPGRSTVNVSTSGGVMTQKLISDQKFLSDMGNGAFNFTANATLAGNVNMLKIFKLKANVYIACDIFFKIDSSTLGLNADSSCTSKIKL